MLPRHGAAALSIAALVLLAPWRLRDHQITWIGRALTQGIIRQHIRHYSALLICLQLQLDFELPSNGFRSSLVFTLCLLGLLAFSSSTLIVCFWFAHPSEHARSNSRLQVSPMKTRLNIFWTSQIQFSFIVRREQTYIFAIAQAQVPPL